MDRIRFIVNAFTRMRLCYLDGRLDFSEKGKPKQNQQDKLPWFLIPRSEDLKILFGHWAALEGKVDVNHIYALDTGCVWGGRLTALRLEDQTWTSVPAKSSIGI
jgi:bis(5'-nucleosyl)-tetraphosphatase (symmetrical)